MDLISPKTRKAFREYFAGVVLREIEEMFADAEIDCDRTFTPPPNVYGERRTFVEQHCATLDFADPRDVQKLLGVYEAVLHDIDDAIAAHPDGRWSEPSKAERVRLTRALERDGFVYEHGKLHASAAASSLTVVAQLAASLDAPGIQRQLDRMQSTCETAPDLAIGTAKELIETVCKTILGEREIEVDDGWTVIQLVKAARESLELLPEDIPEGARGGPTIKAILGNLAAVAHGIAELRNEYGTGHGRHGKRSGLQPRHARLAVLSTAALVTFLLDTHQRKPKA